jgi:uncharacterized protein (TIGR00730 family)
MGIVFCRAPQEKAGKALTRKGAPPPMRRMSEIRSICVYCGSSVGRDQSYIQAGETLGRSIAQAGLTLVYGGGTRGIMGAVARGAASAGGPIRGIIPRFLLNKEASTDAPELTEDLTVVEDMHTRKHMMFEKSDAFVALPGGIGTLEEIVEIMTWAQLGRHRKPIAFANVGGFWSPMLMLMEHMKAEGFVHNAGLVRPLVIERVEDIVPAIIDAAAEAARPAGDERIIERM